MKFKHPKSNTNTAAANAAAQYQLRSRAVPISQNNNVNNQQHSATATNMHTSASSSASHPLFSPTYSQNDQNGFSPTYGQHSSNTASSSLPLPVVPRVNGCQNATARFKAAFDAYNSKPAQPWKGLTVELPESDQNKSSAEAETIILPKTPIVISPFPLMSPVPAVTFSAVHFRATSLYAAAVFSPLDEVKMYTNNAANK